MWLAVALAAPTYLPVTSYIIITLDLPQHDFETNIGKAGPALNDDLCAHKQLSTLKMKKIDLCRNIPPYLKMTVLNLNFAH